MRTVLLGQVRAGRPDYARGRLLDYSVAYRHHQLRESATERIINMAQITLGKLIKLLELEKPDDKCMFDFCWFYPKRLTSWRGDYSHLSFEYAPGHDHYDEIPTVATVLGMCRKAIGHTFQGWKGGDYVGHENTPLWIAQSGEADHTAAVGVSSCGYGYTYIDTQYLEYS